MPHRRHHRPARRPGRTRRRAADQAAVTDRDDRRDQRAGRAGGADRRRPGGQRRRPERAGHRSCSRSCRRRPSPTVDIGGFPFVTQVLGGSFSSVQVTADDATVPDGTDHGGHRPPRRDPDRDHGHGPLPERRRGPGRGHRAGRLDRHQHAGRAAAELRGRRPDADRLLGADRPAVASTATSPVGRSWTWTRRPSPWRTRRSTWPRSTCPRRWWMRCRASCCSRSRSRTCRTTSRSTDLTVQPDGVCCCPARGRTSRCGALSRPSTGTSSPRSGDGGVQPDLLHPDGVVLGADLAMRAVGRPAGVGQEGPAQRRRRPAASGVRGRSRPRAGCRRRRSAAGSRDRGAERSDRRPARRWLRPCRDRRRGPDWAGWWPDPTTAPLGDRHQDPAAGLGRPGDGAVPGRRPWCPGRCAPAARRPRRRRPSPQLRRWTAAMPRDSAGSASRPSPRGGRRLAPG